MQLSHEVRVWEGYLKGRKLPARAAIWTWRKLLLVIPVWTALAVTRLALSTSSTEFLACLCGLLPQYSAGTAAFLLARRTDRLALLLGGVGELAEALQKQGDHEEMRRCAGLVRTARRAVGVYMPSGLSILMVQQVLGEPPAPTIGENPEQPVAHAAVTINETAKWSYYAISYFVLWALLASVLLSLNGMYAAVVRRMAGAEGRLQLRQAARQYQRLLDLQEELKQLTFQPLLHILAGAGVVPLINTYQLLRGVANVFSFLTFSTLPFVFGTLSALGDTLESEDLSQAAFWGVDVVREPLAASKLRLMLVVRASGHQGRPSGFSMRGFGPLNQRAAFNALHRWYQYLQLLMGSAS